MSKNSDTNHEQVPEDGSGVNRPAYLAPDYPYQPSGDEILDLSRIETDNGLYELRCAACTFLIRSQGKNMGRIRDKLTAAGCPYCCSQEPFLLRKVSKSRSV